MSIDNLKNAVPEYAKDLKLNLGSISRTTVLNEEQLWGTLLSTAAATRNAKVLSEIADEAECVLWVDAAHLAGLVAAFVWVAQAERLGGHGVSRGLVAQESARAGVEYALVQLQRADRRRWAPDGRDYDWTFEGAQVTLTIRDESGKVDLNLADMPLLERLLARCEATPDQARGAGGGWKRAPVVSAP